MKKLYRVEASIALFISADSPGLVDDYARQIIRDCPTEVTNAKRETTEVRELSREDSANVPWNAHFGDGDARTNGEVLRGVKRGNAA